MGHALQTTAGQVRKSVDRVQANPGILQRRCRERCNVNGPIVFAENDSAWNPSTTPRDRFISPCSRGPTVVPGTSMTASNAGFWTRSDQFPLSASGSHDLTYLSSIKPGCGFCSRYGRTLAGRGAIGFIRCLPRSGLPLRRIGLATASRPALHPWPAGGIGGSVDDDFQQGPVTGNLFVAVRVHSLVEHPITELLKQFWGTILGSNEGQSLPQPGAHDPHRQLLGLAPVVLRWVRNRLVLAFDRRYRAESPEPPATRARRAVDQVLMVAARSRMSSVRSFAKTSGVSCYAARPARVAG